MKKTLLFLISLFCFFSSVKAQNKITVKFNECVDGDTASVILDNKIIKLRFLAIDTPESVHPTIKEEAHGKEASNYTCNHLKKANKIEIEYDSNGDKTDKYGRHLVWVFVDGKLLQEELIENGLAEVAYLYDVYKYTSILEAKQIVAQTKQVGIWDNTIDYTKIMFFILIVMVGIILFITNKNFRSKAVNKVKKETKKRLKKHLKT